MTKGVNYMLNHASRAQISRHLSQCDDDFVQSLSDRVEIDDYSGKIADKATRFEAWTDVDLIGLVAIYANDTESRVAFVTSVSVLPQWQGRGIASKLMRRCIEYVKEICFRSIELEVVSDNVCAIRLYEKMGFVVDETRGRFATMSLNIKKGTYEQ